MLGGHKILGGQQCLIEVGSAIRVIGANSLFVFCGSYRWIIFGNRGLF